MAGGGWWRLAGGGWLVACQPGGNAEQACAADEARRRQGVNPQKNPAQVPTTDPDSRVMPNQEGDAGNNSGQIMAGMEARNVELYAPAKSSQPQAGNPARREDPGVAVPNLKGRSCPRNHQKQLDKSCFVCVESEEQY